MWKVRAQGAEVPALGLGTFELDDSEARKMVEHALEVGYRHVDTAQAYGNERAVGEAFASSGVPREEVFLTTKVWPDRYPDLSTSVDESLERLGTDHVDLLLLHWPGFEEASLEETLEALGRVRDEGRARHVGVSNFNVRLVEAARKASPVPLAVNQVEYHPFLDQAPVLDAVREAGMALTAYSPLAQGRVTDDGTLREIGERYGKSAAQVALRWLLEQDAVTAIPRTSDEEHCRANFEIFDFELSDEEIERIHGLARDDGRVIDPPELGPAWDT